MRIFILLLTLFFSTSALADRTVLSGDMTQGGLVMGKTEPGTTLYLDGKLVTVASSGRFVFGFGRESKPTSILKILYGNGETEDRLLEVSQREYEVERVDGLAPDKVTPDPTVLARINTENATIARVRAIDTAEEWYLSGWQWPTKGRLSGVYGSQRVLNGIPKQPHFGLDIAAPQGTPVNASTDGTVQMAEEDLYYTGGTVMIDHGYGLISAYSHLSSLSVEAGQFVRQGEKIGEIGSTGRSTGAHLDWRLNWFDTRLDPQLLVEGMPDD